MSLHHTATLNTGAKIPTIGLGTWQSGPGEAGKSVYEALKVGYRHLDFALIYQNQKEIGEYLKKAWSELGIKREDVFITSKLWNSEHRPETVPKALDNTLNELGLDYLDLYLVHWPVAFKEGAGLFPKDQSTGQVQLNLDTSLVDTWKAMIALPKEKTRQVGVSNFRIEALEGIIKATGVVPAVNQIERHPLLLQPELINYCAEKNIHITAYSAFGNNSIGKPLLINTPEVKAVAENASKRLGKPVNGAQVILAWSQVGPKQPHSVIPKSVTPARIASNFDEIELTPDEVAEVNKLGANPVRYNGSYWDINVFNDEDEKKKTHDLKIE